MYGKLRQVVSTNQLSQDDVISGAISIIDGHRFAIFE
jgi:hypothetical protein